MGETRRSFRRTSNLIILSFLALGIVAYFLIPYTNPWAADLVVGIAAFVVLIAVFVRIIW